MNELMQRIERNASLAWAARQCGQHKTAAMFYAEVARLNQLRFK